MIIVKNKEVPYSILINKEDLSSGNLLRPSRVRADKIFTIRQDLVKTRVGTINSKLFENIKLEVLKIL